MGSTKKYIRKLQRVSSDSYTLNIPKEIIDQLEWREHQKIEIVFGERDKHFTVKDA